MWYRVRHDGWSREGFVAHRHGSSLSAVALSDGHWAQGVVAQQHTLDERAGLESIQIRPNVYVIFGAGGNVTVHVGEDGVVLVDSGSSEMAGALSTPSRRFRPRPIRLIINTSADLDHVGGNDIVAARESGSAQIRSAPATTPPCSRTRTCSCA